MTQIQSGQNEFFILEEILIEVIANDLSLRVKKEEKQMGVI